MFEANEQGFLSKPDGTARPDEDIVNAVSGGTLSEKLLALGELEESGVLSRDSRGVLFSRRISRLGEISRERKKAGSKGGSKTKAKVKQNEQQKRGVSDSDSDSDSFLGECGKTDGTEELSIPNKLSTKRFKDSLSIWFEVIRREKGRVNAPAIQVDLLKLSEFSERKAVGYVLAWAAGNRFTSNWKADWESYQPADVPAKQAESIKYKPQPPFPKPAEVNL